MRDGRQGWICYLQLSKPGGKGHSRSRGVGAFYKMECISIWKKKMCKHLIKFVLLHVIKIYVLTSGKRAFCVCMRENEDKCVSRSER